MEWPARCSKCGRANRLASLGWSDPGVAAATLLSGPKSSLNGSNGCLLSAVKVSATAGVSFVPLLLKAWEFDVPLRVVALRGSVPGAWPSDFKTVSGKHARLAYEQRAQLTDIYSELTVGRSGAFLCMLGF